ncbi:F-box domain-containing protein [Rhypophila decipiens]|uniref:F-box domain-containing protein n=1 Tax=Rhypophila decipiens TaxID=261697 RepID=A0AAN6Y419_9PEZI|nr:F-box domain-containing protein [Rhypophila decipiens]
MATIASLPPELLSEILCYLDSPPPSETRLHEQPNPDLLTSPEKSLKNASLVCRKWHATALRILFRHVVWPVDRWELLRVDPSQNPHRDPVDGLPLLSFLRDQDLARCVDSLTMVVRDSLQGMVTGGSRASPGGNGGGEASDSTSPSLLVQHRPGSPMATTYNQDCNWVWDMLFQLTNPRKFTIMASPQILATLLSTRIYIQDAWSFSRTTHHVLSLSRETRTKDDTKAKEPESSPAHTDTTAAPEVPNEVLAEMMGGVSSEVLQRPPTKLFTIRPWTHLLLNEGSSTRVYKTYEFYHRRPPSILGALLGADWKNAPLVPDTLRSLAYVAVFPLSSHFGTLVDHLPRIDRLFVQIVPQDNTLRNPDEMRHVQPSDLWMERNSCYSLVMRQIMSGEMSGHDSDSDTDMSEPDTARESNWRYLKEFESGDAADKEAWDMAVQFVCMSGTDWHVEREGVFVKRPPAARPEHGTSSSPGSYQDEAAPSPVSVLSDYMIGLDPWE